VLKASSRNAHEAQSCFKKSLRKQFNSYRYMQQNLMTATSAHLIRRNEMSKSSLSVFVFGLYMVVLGIVLLVAPNFLLEMFFMPSTTEVWIRIVGVLLLLIAFYFTQTARKEMTEFFKLTVYTRASLIIFFTAFVLLGLASPTLILFGVVDLLGAIWTGLALRSSKLA
jgi:hypothetical protein